jgi:hypothetical protein
LSRVPAPAPESYGLGALPVGKIGAEVEAASLGVPELGPGVEPVADDVGSPGSDVVGVGPVGERSGDGEALGDGDGDVVGADGSGEGVTEGPGDADGDP